MVSGDFPIFKCQIRILEALQAVEQLRTVGWCCVESFGHVFFFFSGFGSRSWDVLKKNFVAGKNSGDMRRTPLYMRGSFS